MFHLVTTSQKQVLKEVEILQKYKNLKNLDEKNRKNDSFYGIHEFNNGFEIQTASWSQS